VVPFIVSRVLSGTLIAVVGAVFAGRPFTIHEFAQFDGGWYTLIAEHGYSMSYVPGVQSSWPFFPLLPFIMGAFHAISVDPRLGGVLFNHGAFLLALAGIYRLASRHGSDRAARLSVWTVALFPTSFVFSMVYPSAIVLAVSVWAFIFAEEHRDLSAGVLAAAATLVRPNGIIVAIALAFAVRFAWRRLPAILGPSVVALGAWLLFVWARTGDPLTFYWAKDGWREITFTMFVTGNNDRLVVLPHLVLALAAFAALVIERRRIPRAWAAFTAMWLLPSFYLGMVGLGRYATDTFPPFVAAGRILERWGTVARSVAFTSAIVGQAAACYWVNWVKDWQTADPGLL
jgi:hypothetical protein